ncbi:MAG: hypothetical protein WCP81_11225, partial [Actinomycetes bacterium]
MHPAGKVRIVAVMASLAGLLGSLFRHKRRTIGLRQNHGRNDLARISQAELEAGASTLSRPLPAERVTAGWRRVGSALAVAALVLTGSFMSTAPVWAVTPAPGASVNITGAWLPTWVAVSPDGAYAYVTDWSGVLHKVDTSTDSIVSTLGGFYSPEEVVVSHDGRYAYVTNRDAHTISQVDLTSFSVSRTYSGMNAAVGITISQDDQTLYATFVGGWGATDGSLVAVDVASGGITTLVSGLNIPRGVSLIPSTSDIMVAEAGGSLRRVNVSTGEQIAIIAGAGYSDIAVDHAGRYAYGTKGSSVVKVELVTNVVVNEFTGFGNPWGVTLTPSDQYLLVANHGGLQQVDAATGVIVARDLGGSELRVAAPAPDGLSAYGVGGYPGGAVNHLGLVVRSATSSVIGAQEILGTGLGVASAVAIAPNGDQWVADYSASTIQVFRGGSVVQTISGPDLVRPHGIVFGRDGTAYVANFGDRIQSTLDG